MNNQQAIDRLVKHLEYGWSEPTVEAIDMGIHALKESRWIPCSEKLPENKEMKYSERLKPCPFCGKKAEFRTNTTGTNGENFKYRFNIRCRNCGMNSSHIYDVEITFRNGDFVIIEDGRDKAVEEWNSRVEDGKTD
jgi:Lar family restriction alleviation protein